MNQSMDDMLAARLDRLEREIRRWRRGTGAAVLVVSAMAIGAGARFAGPGHTIEAGKIVLRDEEGGIIRGEFGIRADGVVGIDLNDATGKKRLGIAVLADGRAGIGLRDKNDKQLLQIFCTPGEEGAGIAIQDSKGDNHLGLGIRPDGEVGLTIAGRDAKGRDDKRGGLIAMPNGTTLLDIRAGGQRGRAMVRCSRNADPELLMWDADGNAREKERVHP